MTARLGIAMLDTSFPRIPGDIGNPATWPFSVRYARVPGASAEAALRRDPSTLTEAFIAAGRSLVDDGCTGIATTCGFLTPLQRDLSAALGVQVATSALFEVAPVLATLPRGRQVGIVTISAATLGPAHLDAAGVPRDTPIVGVDPQGAFARMILGDLPRIDVAACRDEVVAAARRLVAQHPDIGAIVLECTNMAPYARAVQQATGRPVFSIYTHLLWFHAALEARGFAPR